MNVKTLEEIDFFRIREVVADYCITTEGKNNFLQKLPISDSEQIDFLKKCGIEWTRYLNVLHATPLKYWEPIKNLLPKMNKDNMLIIICLYIGHEEGMEESIVVDEFVKSLPSSEYMVSKYQNYNRPSSPYLISISPNKNRRC